MIELNVINNEETNNELDEIVYNSAVNPIVREQSMLSLNDNDYMKAYYGGVQPMALTPSASFWEKWTPNKYFPLLPNAVAKPLLRGAEQIPTGFIKTGIVANQAAAQFFEDMLETNSYASMRKDLSDRLHNGDITQEQYDLGLSDLEKSKQESLTRQQEQAKFEVNQTKNLLKKVDYYKYKINEKMGLLQKKGESTLLNEVLESAPTSLAALGLIAFTKSPQISWGFLTLMQTGEMAQQELEAGENDLYAALLTSGITSGASSVLDVIGLEWINSMWNAPARQFATKCKLFNKIQAWVAGKPNGAFISTAIGFPARAAAASAAEELVTETTQGIIETNLPRFLGKGSKFNSFWDEVSNYTHQGLVGAISGLMFGGVGSSVILHTTYKSLYDWGKKANLSDNDAKELASVVTPVLVEHAEKVKQEAVKSVADLDVSNESIDKAFNILTGGTTQQEKLYVRQSLLSELNKKNPNNTVGNEIAAEVLATTAEFEASITDGNISKKASEYTVEIYQDGDALDISDKAYNARVRKEGRESVEGFVKKDLASNIIYLLNTGNPDTIIHESGHLLLKTISRALNATGQDAFKHPLVNAVIDLVGLPEQGTEFSDAQHEEFAEALQQYAREGVAPNTALASVFSANKRIMEAIGKSAIKSKELTEKGRDALASIFAMNEPDLPNIDINEENVKSLLQTISDINNKRTPSIKNVKVLAELARLRRAKAPIPTGYSLSEFIAEHPEYSVLSPKKKRQLLKENQFQGAEDKVAYPDDIDYIATVERNSENVFSLENEKTKERQDYIQKYNRFKELADSLFPQNVKDFLNLEIAINRILRSGQFVVTDKSFLKDVSDQMKDLLSQVQTYQRADLAEAKKSAEKLKRFLLGTKRNPGFLATMQLTGVSVEGIEKSIDDLDQALLDDNLNKINEYTESLRNRLELAVNRLVEQYVDSDYFARETGSRPPITSPETILADIDSIVGKTVANGDPIKGNSDVIIAIRNTLRSAKIEPDIIQKIINKLLSNQVQLTTAANRLSLIGSIINEINSEYNKKMISKINSAWESLRAKADSKRLTYADSLFVKWVNDNIVNYKKNINERAKDKIKTSLPIYFEQFGNMDDVVLGKDPTKPAEEQDIKMNDEQKMFVNDMMNFILARDAEYDNTPYQYFDIFKSINKMSYMTSDAVARQELAKREKIRKATLGAIEKVAGRKEIPVLGKLDNFFFTGGLSGLRSNLVKVFGQEWANLMDVIVEEDLQHQAKDKIYKRLNKVITDITKGNPNNYLAKLNGETPFANAKEGTPAAKLKDLKYGQIMSIWITSKNDIGHDWVENNFGEDTEAILKLIEKRLRKDDIVIAKEMMKELAALYPDLNRTYFTINGFNMGRLQSYWPVVTEYVSEGQNIKADINVFQMTPKQRKEEGFQKHRFGPGSAELGEAKRMAVWENPIETFRRYVDTATNYIYVVPRLNELSQILNSNTPESKQLQTMIKEKFGENTLVALQKDIRYIMRLDPRERTSSLERMLNEIVSNGVVAKLGLKLMAGFKQVPAAVNFMQLMPAGTFMTYLNKAIQNPKKTWKYMMSKDTVRTRFGAEDLPMFFGNDRSLIVDSMLISSDVSKKLLGEKKLIQASAFLSKLKSKALLNIKTGDIAAVIYGGYAYELYLRDKVAADPQFADYSDAEKENYINAELVSAIQTTQQSGYDTTKGSWQQSRGGLPSVLMRSMLTFSSFQVQQVRKVREAAYEYANGNITKEQLLKTIAVNMFVQPTLYSVLTSPALYIGLFAGMMGLDWGDDEWQDDLYLAFVRPYIDNVAGAGGNFGNVLTSLTDNTAKFFGQSTYGGDGDITPFVYAEWMKAIRKLNSDDIDIMDIFNPAIVTGEDITGLPLQTLLKMLQGIFRTGKGAISAEERQDVLYGFANILGMSEKQFKRLLRDTDK